jgi:hypothetical protein
MIRISKISLFVLLVIAVLTLGAQTVLASTLDLLGVGWNKSEVTVLIEPAKSDINLTLRSLYSIVLL